MRTFVNLTRVDLGFSPDGIVISRMSLQGTSAENASARNRLLEQGIARVRERSVTSVAVSNNVPVEPGLNLALMPPDGALIDQPRPVDWRYVTPDYFSLFRIAARWRHLHRERYGGRRPVVVVNEAFARATSAGSTSSAGRSLRAWTMDRGRSSVSSPMQGALEFWIRAQPAGRRVGIRHSHLRRRRRRQMARFKSPTALRDEMDRADQRIERRTRAGDEAIRALDRRWLSPASKRWHRSFAAISTCSAC